MTQTEIETDVVKLARMLNEGKTLTPTQYQQVIDTQLDDAWKSQELFMKVVDERNELLEEVLLKRILRAFFNKLESA